MLLLRRMGRERQARLPIDEASAVMRLLYDEFACFCAPTFLQNSLDIVLQRLAERRAKGKPDVALLPLPTGAQEPAAPEAAVPLRHLPALLRPAPAPTPTCERDRGSRSPRIPRWFDEQLARASPPSSPRRTRLTSYASRDKSFDPEAPDSLAEPARGRRRESRR